MTKKSTLPFNGTKEQEAELRAALDAIKDKEGALMEALQTAQGIYGYLPKEVQEIVADTLGVSLAEVYGWPRFIRSFPCCPRASIK